MLRMRLAMNRVMLGLLAVQPLSALHAGPSLIATDRRCCHRTVPARLSATSATGAPTTSVTVESTTDYWTAASLLNKEPTFGSSTFYYYSSLRAPSLNANVFFNPIESYCALARDEAATVCGVAQLLLVDLRPEVGREAGKKVAFVQSVAVPQAMRRRGIATRLVDWCEEEARRRFGDVELWLAIAVNNDAAYALYTRMGYTEVVTTGGIALMRKVASLPAPQLTQPDAETLPPLPPPPPQPQPPLPLPPPPPPPAVLTGPAGVGALELAKNVATQGLYCGIAAFGVSVLLAPFGGPSIGSLLLPDSLPIGAAEVAAGLLLGWAELTRRGVRPLAVAADETLDYDAAQALQMAPLYRIAGSEASAAAALIAVAIWQLSIALAEELYYRGLLQGGLGYGLLQLAALVGNGPVGPPTSTLLQLVSLAFASAAFGAVHTEFVEGDGDKARWFVETGAYGVAYGTLALLTHQLLAPVTMHATLNVGLCMRDWRRMRNTPPQQLERVFEEAEAAATGS